VQIAATPDQLHATRVATGEARLILGCDAIVSASAEVLARPQRGMTKAVINSGATPTAQFVRDPHWTFPSDQTQYDLRERICEDCAFLDANRLALALLGDTLYANLLLLGSAWQRGWLPVSYESLDRAAWRLKKTVWHSNGAVALRNTARLRPIRLHRLPTGSRREQRKPRLPQARN
jgi:indolepyruvate ferredoxin oxidoreductase